MSISLSEIPITLSSTSLEISPSPLSQRCKEWFACILFLILGGIFTAAGCTVMVLTKQILYGLLCVFGGILLAIGLLLKPENCVYRKAASAIRSLSNALE